MNAGVRVIPVQALQIRQKVPSLHLGQTVQSVCTQAQQQGSADGAILLFPEASQQHLGIDASRSQPVDQVAAQRWVGALFQVWPDLVPMAHDHQGNADIGLPPGQRGITAFALLMEDLLQGSSGILLVRGENLAQVGHRTALGAAALFILQEGSQRRQQ